MSKILIIEDEAAIRRVLVKILSEEWRDYSKIDDIKKELKKKKEEKRNFG